jgi:hypothetical protein
MAQLMLQAELAEAEADYDDTARRHNAQVRRANNAEVERDKCKKRLRDCLKRLRDCDRALAQAKSRAREIAARASAPRTAPRPPTRTPGVSLVPGQHVPARTPGVTPSRPPVQTSYLPTRGVYRGPSTILTRAPGSYGHA